MCRKFEAPFYKHTLYVHSQFYIFFRTTHFWQHSFGNIAAMPYGINNNKLMWQSYFLVFRKLQNNVTCYFLIINTFVSNTRPRFDEKYQNEYKESRQPGNPPNMDSPSFLQENLETPPSMIFQVSTLYRGRGVYTVYLASIWKDRKKIPAYSFWQWSIIIPALFLLLFLLYY